MACESEEKTKKKPDFKRTIKVDWEVCEDSTAYTSHKIDDDEGILGLKQYKSYIDRVKDTLVNTDPKGFPNMDDKLNYGSEVCNKC